MTAAPSPVKAGIKVEYACCNYGCTETVTKICSCNLAMYCSMLCADKHWHSHQKTCAVLKSTGEKEAPKSLLSLVDTHNAASIFFAERAKSNDPAFLVVNVSKKFKAQNPKSLPIQIEFIRPSNSQTSPACSLALSSKVVPYAPVTLGKSGLKGVAIITEVLRQQHPRRISLVVESVDQVAIYLLKPKYDLSIPKELCLALFVMKEKEKASSATATATK
jgi:hypothetical protein